MSVTMVVFVSDDRRGRDRCDCGARSNTLSARWAGACGSRGFDRGESHRPTGDSRRPRHCSRRDSRCSRDRIRASSDVRRRHSLLLQRPSPLPTKASPRNSNHAASSILHSFSARQKTPQRKRPSAGGSRKIHRRWSGHLRSVPYAANQQRGSGPRQVAGGCTALAGACRADRRRPLKAPRIAGTPPGSDSDLVTLLTTGSWRGGQRLRPPMPHAIRTVKTPRRSWPTCDR